MDEGGILEMEIWRVPATVSGSVHDLKYSLYYSRHGKRLGGYDNERGKSAHRDDVTLLTEAGLLDRLGSRMRATADRIQAVIEL